MMEGRLERMLFDVSQNLVVTLKDTMMETKKVKSVEIGAGWLGVAHLGLLHGQVGPVHCHNCPDRSAPWVAAVNA